ncbi:bifunctional sulfur transferase/dioxygenase Blh [Erwinia sp. PK3-005]
MNLRHYNEQISFVDALNADEFAHLHQLGYRMVINNRPDEEEGGFLTHQQEQQLADSQGIKYLYLPFIYDTLTREDVYTFHRLVKSGKKLIAHCRSGARSVSLFFLHALCEGVMDEKAFQATCRQYDVDAAPALAWYARQQQIAPVAEVHSFYEPKSGSLQYVIADPETRRCAIIDPVLDFDRNSGAVSHRQAQMMLDFIHRQNWRLSWILDTHPHADHFSAAAWLARQTGAPSAIGEKISQIQDLWKAIYHLPALPAPESIWDARFKDGDIFYIGNLRGEVIFSPGHTLASVTYHIGNCAFIHDTLFMPDSGTARTDFPGGSAEALWETLQRILSLPDDTRLFTGHDYCPDGREVQYESSVALQRSENAWLAGNDKAAFIAKRTARDATLPLPDLMLMALQINISGGNLPEPENNGKRYLKIPLNSF